MTTFQCTGQSNQVNFKISTTNPYTVVNKITPTEYNFQTITSGVKFNTVERSGRGFAPFAMAKVSSPPGRSPSPSPSPVTANFCMTCKVKISTSETNPKIVSGIALMDSDLNVIFEAGLKSWDNYGNFDTVPQGRSLPPLSQYVADVGIKYDNQNKITVHNGESERVYDNVVDVKYVALFMRGEGVYTCTISNIVYSGLDEMVDESPVPVLSNYIYTDSGVTTNADTIGEEGTADLEGCKAVCEKTVNCTAIEYDSMRSRCTLKNFVTTGDPLFSQPVDTSIVGDGPFDTTLDIIAVAVGNSVKIFDSSTYVEVNEPLTFGITSPPSYIKFDKYNNICVASQNNNNVIVFKRGIDGKYSNYSSQPQQLRPAQPLSATSFVGRRYASPSNIFIEFTSSTQLQTNKSSSIAGAGATGTYSFTFSSATNGLTISISPGNDIQYSYNALSDVFTLGLTRLSSVSPSSPVSPALPNRVEIIPGFTNPKKIEFYKDEKMYVLNGNSTLSVYDLKTKEISSFNSPIPVDDFAVSKSGKVACVNNSFNSISLQSIFSIDGGAPLSLGQKGLNPLYNNAVFKKNLVSVSFDPLEKYIAVSYSVRFYATVNRPNIPVPLPPLNLTLEGVKLIELSTNTIIDLKTDANEFVKFYPTGMFLITSDKVNFIKLYKRQDNGVFIGDDDQLGTIKIITPQPGIDNVCFDSKLNIFLIGSSIKKILKNQENKSIITVPQSGTPTTLYLKEDVIMKIFEKLKVRLDFNPPLSNLPGGVRIKTLIIDIGSKRKDYMFISELTFVSAIFGFSISTYPINSTTGHLGFKFDTSYGEFYLLTDSFDFNNIVILNHEFKDVLNINKNVTVSKQVSNVPINIVDPSAKWYISNIREKIYLPPVSASSPVPRTYIQFLSNTQMSVNGGTPVNIRLFPSSFKIVIKHETNDTTLAVFFKLSEDVILLTEYYDTFFGTIDTSITNTNITFSKNSPDDDLFYLKRFSSGQRCLFIDDTIQQALNSVIDMYSDTYKSFPPTAEEFCIYKKRFTYPSETGEKSIFFKDNKSLVVNDTYTFFYYVISGYVIFLDDYGTVNILVFPIESPKSTNYSEMYRIIYPREFIQTSKRYTVSREGPYNSPGVGGRYRNPNNTKQIIVDLGSGKVNIRRSTNGITWVNDECDYLFYKFQSDYYVRMKLISPTNSVLELDYDPNDGINQFEGENYTRF